MRKLFVVSLSLLGAAGSASAQTQYYDFNSYNHVDIGSITDLTYSGSGFNGAPESAGGLDDDLGNPTGGLRAQGAFSLVTNDDAVSFDTSGSFSVTQSVYFKTVSDFSGLTADNQDVAMLGLTDQSAQNTPSSLQGFNFEYLNATVRVTDSSAGDFRFLNAASADSPNLTLGFEGSFAVDSWYLFTATFAYDSGNDDWSITSRLDLTDSRGDLISNIASETKTINNSGLFVNGAGLRGFFASETAGIAGLSGFDDATLVAVPESSTYALIVGFLALGAITTRRRRL